MHSKHVAGLWGLLFGLLAAQSAASATVQSHLATKIYGGEQAPQCAWPSTVMVKLVDAVCSGSLVDPNIVVYAAHCGTDVQVIAFGENMLQTPPFLVVPQSCHLMPGHSPENGSDFAYCKLAAPVLNVPVVPILMGCELAVLQPKKPIVLVGFGLDAAQTVGVKHEVNTVHDFLISNKAYVGGNGNDTCNGDSGGPAYVRLTPDDNLPGMADGAWRVYGITSYGLSTACTNGSFDSIMSNGVAWIESDSGVDITPCHDAYGNWQPGPRCGAFPVHPDAPSANWSAMCASLDTTGYSATCGPPYDAASPITVTFLQPSGTLKAKEGTDITVQIAVANADPQGGALRVKTTLDGMPLTSQDSGPNFAFGSHSAEAGLHTLIATVQDANGNSRIEQLSFQVVSQGGGCSASSPPSWAPMVLVVMLALRRWRRAHRAMTLGFVAGALLTTSCSNSETITTIPKKSITVAVNPAPNPDLGVPPQVTNVASGSVAGHEFSPGAAMYIYGEAQTSASQATLTVLQLIVVDQPNYCNLIQINADSAQASYFYVDIFDTTANADAPTDGDYQVVDPNTALPQPGKYAIASFVKNSPTCSNTLTPTQANATAGTVSVKTIISTAGTYISAEMPNLQFGAQDDTVSLSVVALGCTPPESAASLAAQCL